VDFSANCHVVVLSLSGLPHNAVTGGLKQRVQDFQSVLPVVISLRNPALKDRHWRKIENVLDKSIITNSAVSLGDLLDARVYVL
jgi:dynein heavy chain, axonemal